MIEKNIEYNNSVMLIFVDFGNSFDYFKRKSHHAFTDCNIDHRCTSILSIFLDKDTNAFRIEKGVRQGDNIFPQLFTILLENACRTADWKKIGINIDGKFLNKLKGPRTFLMKSGPSSNWLKLGYVVPFGISNKSSHGHKV